MRNTLASILVTMLLLLMINITQLKAQDSPGLPCGDPDLDCPIDGLIILLVAAILFLSVKKITGVKRSQKQVVKEV